MVGPRNRATQGVVDLESSGGAAEAAKAATVGSGKRAAGDSGEYVWSHVEENGSARRQVGESGDPGARFDLSAQGAKVRRQGIDNCLRSAGGKRPTPSVGGDR